MTTNNSTLIMDPNKYHLDQDDHEVEYFNDDESSSDLSKFCQKYKKDHDSHFTAPGDDACDRLGIKDKTLRHFIPLLVNLTTLILVSTYNGQTGCGTGFVHRVGKYQEDELCPCEKCKAANDHRAWANVEISTARHVIKDRGKNSPLTVTFFYDSDDPDERKKEVTLQVLDVRSERQDKDWCLLRCVTHDDVLIKDLREWSDQLWSDGKRLREVYGNSHEDSVYMVSHPHGGPKKISTGRVQKRTMWKEISDDEEWCRYNYEIPSCSGSSGAFVYVLGKWRDGCGFWFGHAHCHRANGKSSAGAESK